MSLKTPLFAGVSPQQSQRQSPVTQPTYFAPNITARKQPTSDTISLNHQNQPRFGASAAPPPGGDDPNDPNKNFFKQNLPGDEDIDMTDWNPTKGLGEFLSADGSGNLRNRSDFKPYDKNAKTKTRALPKEVLNTLSKEECVKQAVEEAKSIGNIQVAAYRWGTDSSLVQENVKQQKQLDKLEKNVSKLYKQRGLADPYASQGGIEEEYETQDEEYSTKYRHLGWFKRNGRYHDQNGNPVLA